MDWSTVSGFSTFKGQLVRPIAPHIRLGTPVETFSSIKVWKLWETAIAQTPLWINVLCCLEQETQPLLGKAFSIGIYNETFHWGGWIISFPGTGKLLNLPWDSIVLLQTGPVKMLYTWNGTRAIEKRENRSGLPYPFPGPSLLSWQHNLPWPICMVCATRSSSWSCPSPSSQGQVYVICLPLMRSWGCRFCSLTYRS